MTQITKGDALLAIDAAMAALSTARVLVEAIGDEPAEVDGGCKHIRQHQTFTSNVCRDCGEELGVPVSDDSTTADSISSEVSQ
jgi:hypothetical protein